MNSATPAENAEATGQSRVGADYGADRSLAKGDIPGDWARMCYVINDFRWRHGHWPTRFRMSARQFESVRELFTPQDFAKIAAKIDFITDASAYQAEDERGASCGYRQEFLRAADWLGVNPKLRPNRSSKAWWRLW